MIQQSDSCVYEQRRSFLGETVEHRACSYLLTPVRHRRQGKNNTVNKMEPGAQRIIGGFSVRYMLCIPTAEYGKREAILGQRFFRQSR